MCEYFWYYMSFQFWHKMCSLYYVNTLHNSLEKQCHWKLHPTFAQWFMDSILLDYYFQFSMWLNSQSIKLLFHHVMCIAKFPVLELKYKHQWSTKFPCGYCVFCCRFVDGGVLMSATFKPKHTNKRYHGALNMLDFLGTKGFWN